MPRSLWCSSTRKPGVKSCSRKLRPRTSMTLFAARPPDSTSMIVAGSTPAFDPRTSASLTASIVSATTTWLHALTTWPAADRPDVHDRLAERLEERLRTGEVLLGAAGHDRQRRLAGADVAAAHRRVDPADAAARAHALGERARDHRRDRAHVDDERALARAGQQPVVAVEDLLHLRRVGEHEDDDAGLLGDLARVRGGGRVVRCSERGRRPSRGCARRAKPPGGQPRCHPVKPSPDR